MATLIQVTSKSLLDAPPLWECVLELLHDIATSWLYLPDMRFTINSVERLFCQNFPSFWATL